MKKLTISVSIETLAALEEKKQKDRTSLNQTVNELINIGLGNENNMIPKTRLIPLLVHTAELIQEIQSRYSDDLEKECTKITKEIETIYGDFKNPQ